MYNPRHNTPNFPFHGLDIETHPDEATREKFGNDPDILPVFEPPVFEEPELKYGNAKTPEARERVELAWSARVEQAREDFEEKSEGALDRFEEQIKRTMSLDRWLARIPIIALDVPDNEPKVFTTIKDSGFPEYPSEEEMLLAFWDYVNPRTGEFVPLVGHNLKEFDLKLIVARSLRLGVLTFNRAKAIRETYLGPEWKTGDYIVDTIEPFGREYIPANRKSLNFMAKILLGKEKVSDPAMFGGRPLAQVIPEAIAAGEGKLIAKYCIEDAVLARELAVALRLIP